MPKSLWAGYEEEDEPQPGGDRAKVIWSGYEEEEEPRRQDDADHVAPVEPEAPREQQAQPQNPSRPVIVAAVAAVVMVSLAIAFSDRGSLAVGAVPSYWEDVPMRCDTVRLEQDQRAVELFRCRALIGGRLPPGVYRSPGSQWTSDITRRDARANAIRIAPDEELVGWAVY